MRLFLFHNVGADILNELIYSIEYSASSIPHKPTSAFKPSMLKCEREVFFAFKNFDKDASSVDYQGIGILESGTDRHKRIQDAIQNSKTIKYLNILDYINEKKLDYLSVIGEFGNETLMYDKRYNMRFMTDGIIEYKGRRYILEIKTESMMKFDKHDTVWEEHFNQASCYSMAFGINDVLFLYENRDTLAKKIIELTVTEDMKQSVIDFINSVNKHIQENSLPKKNEGKNCRWCGYRIACKGI